MTNTQNEKDIKHVNVHSVYSLVEHRSSPTDVTSTFQCAAKKDFCSVITLGLHWVNTRLLFY